MRADEARRLLMTYALTGALTRRQEQIVRLLADGMTIAQVAVELGIAESTIHSHLGKIPLNVAVYEQRKAHGR